jgi:formate/nitrite transporter FocA (FNT family)
MTGHIKRIVSAIIAGVLIGIGGTAFLAIDNKMDGAFMFSLGLMLICMNNLNLFTGKVCYAETLQDAIGCIEIWCGNFIGCWLIGTGVRFGREDLVIKATEICSAKLAENYYVIFLGVMCNILIFFAVNGFRENKFKFGKYFALIMCVMAFILCGFEHCIANIYYFTVSGTINLPYIMLNTIGNTIGGYGIYAIYKRIGGTI